MLSGANNIGGIAATLLNSAGIDNNGVPTTFERCVFNGSISGGAKYCGGILANGNSIPARL